MEAKLISLPSELINMITDELGLHEVGNLRLTCRALASKAVSKTFARLFENKTIRLTRNSLENLIHVTQPGSLGCLLQDCTVTGKILLADCAGEPRGAEHHFSAVTASKVTGEQEMKEQYEAAIAQQEEETRLLTKAFQNLRKHNPNKAFASVQLRLEVDEDVREVLSQLSRDNRWRPVWKAALRTFEVTVQALQKAQIPVLHTFDVFNSLKGCSLGYSAFIDSMKTPEAQQVFGSLRRLEVSLSLSHDRELGRVQPDCQEANSLIMYDSVRRQLSTYILTEMLQLLIKMPKVQEFILHWFHLLRPFHEHSDREAPLTPQGLESPHKGVEFQLHKLEFCKLSGLEVPVEELQTFLQATRPSKLSLCAVNLNSNEWSSIFSQVVGPESPQQHLHFNDLMQAFSMVHFEVLGSSKFPYLRGMMGPSRLKLTREEIEATSSLRYRLPRSRALGSPAHSRWLRRWIESYGPPAGRGGSYDFVRSNWPPPDAPRSPETDEDDSYDALYNRVVNNDALNRLLPS